MHTDFADRQVLVTQASDYMGPAIAARFREAGANVAEINGSLADRRSVEAALAQWPAPDILIVLCFHSYNSSSYSCSSSI